MINWTTIFHFANFVFLSMSVNIVDDLAIENLRDYLRIPTVHPDVDYSSAVEFLEKLAKDIGLPIDILRIRSDKPVVIFEWPGSNSSLKSLMFNSHMDVVAVDEDLWHHPPFGAEMDKEGNIYARGAQDMKSIGIQYLEAIRRLKLRGFKPKRSIYVTFVPDEETGGALGMKELVKTDCFKKMNPAFAFDEEAVHPLPNHFFVSYGQKTLWFVRITCTGPTGHGALLLNHTAAEKILFIMNRFEEFRQSELNKPVDLKAGKANITTINLTKLNGGLQENVIPPQFTATFDVRIGIGVDLERFESMIGEWCQKAGEGVSYDFVQKSPFSEPTQLDQNIFWETFENTLHKMDYHLETRVLPASIDARFIRQAGVPAIGFQALNNMTPRAHGNDEYVNKDIFLNGIKIYENVMMSLGNLD